MTYLIQDITFYKVDENGDEILNQDGTLKVYRIKDGIRVKPLEYLSEEFEDDIMQESEDKKQWLKQKRKNLSVMIDIVSVMVRPHMTMKKRGLYD